MKTDSLNEISAINDLVLESRILGSEKEIVKKFVNLSTKLLKADYGYAFRWDETSKQFDVFYRDPNTPYPSKTPRKHGVTAKAFKKKSPFFISNVPKTNAVRSDATKFMKAVVVIPISYGSDKYGTIDICFYKKHIFSKKERMICEYIGNTAAQTITIHRLYSDLKDFKNRLDRTLDAVTIFDPKTLKVEYANLGAVKLSGFSLPEIIQKTIFEIQPHFNEKKFQKVIEPLIKKEKGSITIETYIKTKSGKSIPVEMFMQRSQPMGGRVKFLSIVHDLTERKKVEKTSAKLLKQKDEFFNMASHELKTPVTTIKGFAQLLSEQLQETGGKTQHYLEKINTQINKLSHLINDLLDISRIETGKLKFEKATMDLNELTKCTVEDLRMAITDHKITFKNYRRLWVEADSERMEQVLINLITNAAKYSKAGTEIIIRVSEEKNYARVEVEDFGFGIRKDDQHKVFHPFFQSNDPAKNTFTGLGLGLYISQKIVRHHGGMLDFISKKDTPGTIFYFKLPCARPKK